MDQVELTAALLMGGLALVIGWRVVRNRRAGVAESESRPHELRSAQIAYVEQTFRSNGEIEIVA